MSLPWRKLENQRAIQLLLELSLLYFVLTVSISFFHRMSVTAPYHPDETHYILTSRYFQRAIIEHDFQHPDWAESYVTKTQPMLARYAVGGALWVQGVDLEDLPLAGDYDFLKTMEENEELGTVPDDWLLNFGRSPMIGFAVGAAGLVYLLGRFIAGPLAGLAALTLTLGSPLVGQSLVRAVPDAMLMFFLLLTLVVSIIGARRSDGGLDLGWALAVGISLGLAMGSKLSAGISVLAILSWAGIAALLALGLASSQGWRARLVAAWSASRGWLLAVGIALHVFIISDPFLWPDPGVNMLKLFSQLAFENQVVQAQFPDAFLNFTERPRFVVEGSLVAHTLTAQRGFPIEPFLAALGASGVFFQVWLSWRRERVIRSRGLLLVSVLTYYLCLIMSISMSWQRYLLPTVILSAVFSGIGITWIIHTITGTIVTLVSSVRRFTLLGLRPRST